VFLLLYPIGVAALLVALYAGSQPLRPGEERVLRAVLAVFGSALSLGGAIALSRLDEQPGHSPAEVPLAHAAFGALMLGGALYVVGLVTWRGGVAFALRLAGWVLMVLAVGLPSSLLLGLPFVCALAVGLRFPPPTGSIRSARPRRPALADAPGRAATRRWDG